MKEDSFDYIKMKHLGIIKDKWQIENINCKKGNAISNIKVI